MKVDLGIWARLSRLVVLLLFLAGVVGVAVWYLPLIQQNERYRQRVLQRQIEIREQEERASQLEAAIRALRTDTRAVERLAREKLGYVKPGETRIQFEEPSTNRLARWVCPSSKSRCRRASRSSEVRPGARGLAQGKGLA
jgi:cell division protein FtsB